MQRASRPALKLCMHLSTSEMAGQGTAKLKYQIHERFPSTFNDYSLEESVLGCTYPYLPIFPCPILGMNSYQKVCQIVGCAPDYLTSFSPRKVSLERNKEQKCTDHQCRSVPTLPRRNSISSTTPSAHSPNSLKRIKIQNTLLDVQETDFKLSKKLSDTPYHLQDSQSAASAFHPARRLPGEHCAEEGPKLHSRREELSQGFRMLWCSWQKKSSTVVGICLSGCDPL